MEGKGTPGGGGQDLDEREKQHHSTTPLKNNPIGDVSPNPYVSPNDEPAQRSERLASAESDPLTDYPRLSVVWHEQSS